MPPQSEKAHSQSKEAETRRPFSELAAALLPYVQEAGRLQLSHYRTNLAVESKADQSPVTVADRGAEAILLEALAAIDPGVPVLAEEAVAQGGLPEVGKRFYLVDPLDGTREFIAGRDEFTINIALVEEAVPRFGLIYAPAVSRLFLALGPRCAFEYRLEADSEATSLADAAGRPLTVGAPDLGALRAAVSRSHLDDASETLLTRLRVRRRVSAGSSLKFCLLAAGEADLYPRFGRTMEWDTAAGHAILAAAGGEVLTLEGAPLRYGKASQGFANPGFVAITSREIARLAIVS